MNAALLRAIAEDADADEPRLVYADWCEEQGDAARAALIRIQLELAPLPPWDPRRIGLEVSVAALLRAHAQSWLAELPVIEGVAWSGFERGFIGQAEASTFAALCDAQDQLAGLPIQRVVVPWPEDAAAAARSRALPSVRELRIDRAIRDEHEPAWLSRAAVLSTIHQLELMDGYAPQSGSREILLSPHLRQLRTLHMLRHQTGQHGVHAIIEADFPELTSLALSELGDNRTSWSDWDNGLNAEALATLADWPGLARVRTLDLSDNRIGGEELDAMFRSPHLTALESLVLNDIFANVDEIPWERLEHLRLRELAVGGRTAFYDADSIDAVARAACLTELRQLSLERTVFEGMLPAFLETALARRVEVLDLSDIDPGDDDLSVFARVELPTLHTLRLANVYGLDNAKIAPIFGSALLASLGSLDVRGNRYSSRGVTPLIESPHTDHLQRLAVDLDDEGRALLLQSGLGTRLEGTGGLELAE